MTDNIGNKGRDYYASLTENQLQTLISELKAKAEVHEREADNFWHTIRELEDIIREEKK